MTPWWRNPLWIVTMAVGMALIGIAAGLYSGPFPP
jgi:hypothetical protein